MSSAPPEPIVPRLRPGARLRVVSPSRSLAVVPADVRELARRRLEAHGFALEAADLPFTTDQFVEASVEARVAELVAAWTAPDVDGLLTAIGGWSSNALLGRIDWSLLERHPKVLCGHSDATALLLALHVRCGVVTYFGPHFSNLGMRHGAEYTWEHFLATLNGEPEAVRCAPSERWSDDAWYRNQDERAFHANPGLLPVRVGAAQGRLIAGNLSTLRLLQGTPYFPSLRGAILLVEDVARDPAAVPRFQRELQALMHHPEFPAVRGLVVGRFASAAGLSRERLRAQLAALPELRGMPVAADADFGHTTPQLTLPIGGSVRLSVSVEDVQLTIAPDGRWHD